MSIHKHAQFISDDIGRETDKIRQKISQKYWKIEVALLRPLGGDIKWWCCLAEAENREA